MVDVPQAGVSALFRWPGSGADAALGPLRKAALVSKEQDTAWRRPEAGASPALGELRARPSMDAAEPAPPPAPDRAAAAFAPLRGSPVPREWLIAAASAVLGAIIGIAGYSVAVSSGDNGGGQQLAFGGPGAGRPLQPAGPAPGQQQVPQANLQANLLPRAPDFIGQVRVLIGSSLTVDTPQGSRVVQVTAETQVVLSNGSAGSRTDLTRGATVAVVTTNDPVTRELRAEAIGLLGR